MCYGIFNLPVMYSRAAEAAAHAGIRAPAEMRSGVRAVHTFAKYTAVLAKSITPASAAAIPLKGFFK